MTKILEEEPRVVIDELPAGTREMVALLDEAYPDSEIDRLCRLVLLHGMDVERVHRYRGMREMIDHMKMLVAAQDEIDAENDPAVQETEDGRPRILRRPD